MILENEFLLWLSKHEFVFWLIIWTISGIINSIIYLRIHTGKWERKEYISYLVMFILVGPFSIMLWALASLGGGGSDCDAGGI